MDPDRLLAAFTEGMLARVPDELEQEVLDAVDGYVRGAWSSLLDEVGPPSPTVPGVRRLVEGHVLLRRLGVAPGYALRLHPAVGCGEVRPWLDDGSGLPARGPRVRYRRDASVLCGVLVLACVLAERRGTPVPPELLAASTRLLSGGHVEVVW